MGIGACLGGLFPLVAYFFRGDSEFLFLEISTAPIVLGLAAYLFGKSQERSTEYAAYSARLEEFTRQLEDAQKIARVGNWTFDPESGALWWSKQLFDIFGIDRGTASSELYSVYLSRIHPEDRPELVRRVQNTIERGEGYSIEHRIVLPDASVRYIRGTGEMGESLGRRVLKGVAQDITIERRREAQAIAKIGSWEFDLHTKAQVWSEEHYRIFEIESPQSQDELFRLYRSRIHPEDLPELDLLLRNAVERGENFAYHHRVVLDDGTRVKYVLGIGNVKFDSLGKPKLVTGTCQDITDRVLAERENQFTLNALRLGVWKYNPTNQSVHWDSSMYRLFEVDSREFNGHYEAWEKTLTPETKKKTIEELEMALRGEKEFNTTFEILTPSGKRKQIGGRGEVLRDARGRPIMMYGVNWDRTQEVELEQALAIERVKALHQAKLASLGEMSAGIAHEINNPLAVIAGNLPLISKYRDQPEKLETKVAAMNRAVVRIEKIVHGLRKFSRTSDEVQRQEESVLSLIEEVVTLIEPKAKRNSVLVRHCYDPVRPLYCDLVEIEQVLVNLLNNAIDAVAEASEKWVRIFVLEENESTVIRIMDSGPGVPREIEEKVFQPFFTTKSVGAGTGLGLSISRGILEQHGASLSINRGMNHSCFEVRFPNARWT